MMHHQSINQTIIHFIPSILPFAGDFYTCKALANGCNPGNPGQTGYDNWCCNPDGSSGYSGRLSWDPLTVLIAVRGVEDNASEVLSQALGVARPTAVTPDSDDSQAREEARAIDAVANLQTELEAARLTPKIDDGVDDDDDNKEMLAVEPEKEEGGKADDGALKLIFDATRNDDDGEDDDETGVSSGLRHD